MIIAFVTTMGGCTLLGGCEKAIDLEQSKPGPVAVFNELWGEIDRRYALFPVKQVDWDSVYTAFAPRIREGMDEKALFQVLSSMLETLRDGHVALSSRFDASRYDNFFRLYPANFNYNNIVRNYLLSDFTVSGPFLYAVRDNVGYLYCETFSGPSVDEDLEKALVFLGNTRGLIVDIRSNPGGSLSNAQALASLFFRERTLVGYEKAKAGRDRNAFTEARPLHIGPGRLSYAQPVIVLTNRACFSACNDFALYMSLLPQVRLYGDQTGGGGSVPLDFILSNGWKVQYSSTMTLSPQLASVEPGIQPDVNLQVSSLQESVGVDPILEKAFLDLR